MEMLKSIGVELPSLEVILFVVAISGAASWGVTQILRQAIMGLLKYHKIDHSPWWYNSSLRVLSLLSGGVCGYLLGGMVGLLMGVGCGGLNTFLVAQIKAFLKKKAQG